MHVRAPSNCCSTVTAGQHLGWCVCHYYSSADGGIRATPGLIKIARGAVRAAAHRARAREM